MDSQTSLLKEKAGQRTQVHFSPGTKMPSESTNPTWPLPEPDPVAVPENDIEEAYLLSARLLTRQFRNKEREEKAKNHDFVAMSDAYRFHKKLEWLATWFHKALEKLGGKDTENTYFWKDLLEAGSMLDMMYLFASMTIQQLGPASTASTSRTLTFWHNRIKQTFPGDALGDESPEDCDLANKQQDEKITKLTTAISATMGRKLFDVFEKNDNIYSALEKLVPGHSTLYRHVRRKTDKYGAVFFYGEFWKAMCAGGHGLHAVSNLVDILQFKEGGKKAELKELGLAWVEAQKGTLRRKVFFM